MSISPKRLGKYELQMRLGQGGMAEVWKAFDPQLKRLVAIKFLHANLRSDPDFTNRFVREGQAIAALRHPNIVQVYDFHVSLPEDENPMAYMVMDYIEGLTLADYLRRTSYANNIPFDDEIVRLFTSLSSAVDYAHAHHMIHRDIKPANILLDTRNIMHNTMGEPILTDFGIVKMLGGEAMTSTGVSMGTPLYISPELLIPGQTSNEKSDIYALGVILYEMCTGEPPYRGDNSYIILAQRISGPPSLPSKRNPHISPALDEVILRCLAMDPTERFASASELTASLAKAVDVPIPDLVRHTLSLRTSSSGLPTVEVSPLIAPAVAISDSHKSELPLTGSATIPANFDAYIASAHKDNTPRETLQSGINSQQPDSSVLPSSSQSVTPLPSSETLPVAVAPGSPTQALQRKHWPFNWLLTLRILLLIVLVSAGISAYALLHRNPATTPPGSLASIGNATFLSSGQLDTQNTAFMNDGIQVRLSHLPNPASGYRYYTWLQDDIGATTSIFLGALQVHQGAATLSYIDNQHRNLLAYVSTFLVTEQAASTTPTHPSSDRKQWKYVAMLPQTPSSLDHTSYLDHLRQLLVSDPTLAPSQGNSGLNFLLLNTIENLYTNTLALRDDSNLQQMRQSSANLLSYLDGPCAPQELNSTPESKTPANATLAHATSISLLDCVQETNHLGYLTLTAQELNAMVTAPGVLTQEAQRTAQVSRYLSMTQEDLEQMRTDVLQLAHLDTAHLQQALVLRNDLVNWASTVISGQFDPVTQTLHPGIAQICTEIAFLAHFDVLPYKNV